MRGFTQQQQQDYAQHQLDQANKGHSGLGFSKQANSSAGQGKHTVLHNKLSTSSIRVMPSKKQQQEKLKRLYPAIFDFLVFCDLDKVAKVFAEETEMVSL